MIVSHPYQTQFAKASFDSSPKITLWLFHVSENWPCY